MSKDNVKKMFGKMQNDTEFQKKYAQLMKAHGEEAEKILAEKIIELGNSSGFNFSKDDLMAARAEFVDKSNQNVELSDNDLADVAGGDTKKFLATIVSISGFGIACAGVSIVSELKKAGECGKMMSTTVSC